MQTSSKHPVRQAKPGLLLRAFRGLGAVCLLGAPALSACSSSHQLVRDTDHEMRAGAMMDSRDAFTVRVRRNAHVVSVVLASPADSVWAAVPKVYQDLGYEGGPSVRGERVYLTRELTIRQRLYDGELNSTYLDCGQSPAGAPAADEYVVTFAILMRVDQTVDNKSRLEIMVDGRARDRTKSNASAVFCTGTGLLEGRFIEAVKRRLAL